MKDFRNLGEKRNILFLNKSTLKDTFKVTKIYRKNCLNLFFKM